MRLREYFATVLLAIGLCGCGGPGLGSQGDANYWAGKAPAGLSSDKAHETLSENGFCTWSTGRVIYGYRDRVASSNYSNGVSTQTFLDPTDHVTSTEAYASPVTPYPQLAPTYP
jgi:hypothetical protein